MSSPYYYKTLRRTCRSYLKSDSSVFRFACVMTVFCRRTWAKSCYVQTGPNLPFFNSKHLSSTYLVTAFLVQVEMHTHNRTWRSQNRKIKNCKPSYFCCNYQMVNSLPANSWLSWKCGKGRQKRNNKTFVINIFTPQYPMSGKYLASFAA